MKEKPVGRFNLSFNVRPVVGKKIVASNAVGTRIGIGGGMQAWQPVNLQSVQGGQLLPHPRCTRGQLMQTLKMFWDVMVPAQGTHTNACADINIFVCDIVVVDSVKCPALSTGHRAGHLTLALNLCRTPAESQLRGGRAFPTHVWAGGVPKRKLSVGAAVARTRAHGNCNSCSCWWVKFNPNSAAFYPCRSSRGVQPVKYENRVICLEF